MTLFERISAIIRGKAAYTDESPSRLVSGSAVALMGSQTVRPEFSHRAAVKSCQSWIYAAARMNAIAVASQPLRLYVRSRGTGTKLWNTRRTDRRTKAYLAGDLAQLPSRHAMRKAAEFGDEYEIVTDNHPILDLLSTVNPYQNGFDATVLRVLYLELTGNAYIHPVLDRRLGVPVELWTMPSQWVEIVPGEAARGEPFVKGYRYGASDSQKVEFAPDEVIHFKYPNPRDVYYGLGKVEAAWGAVTSNEALHEMDYFFFKNKSRPDYLAVIKGNASADELDRFTVEVESKMRGTSKTGRFLAVTGDVDLKPLSFPPKDLSGREEIVEEIAAIFGVPVSMLRANDPNLASATVGFASWKETTILPACRMDEEVLNAELLPLFGIEGDAFLAYDNPVKRDEIQESTKRLSYVQGGILTPNEARKQEGLDAVDDPMADRLLINGQPLGGSPPASPGGGLGGLFGASISDQVQTDAAQPSSDDPSAKVIDAKDALGDCVSEKIPKLLDEGYPQDQAIAIAYSMCSEGKSIEEVLRERSHSMSVQSKAITDIDTTPPQAVADNARRALEVRARKPESQRGMTAIGLARARDLQNRKPLSEDTIRRMVAYFERHQSDKEGVTWDEQGKGWQAWNGWGGDDGWAWARRKVDEFDRERAKRDSFRKNSCGCGCAKVKRLSHRAIWEDAVSDEIQTKSAESEGRKINKIEDDMVSGVSAVFDQQTKDLLKLLKSVDRPTGDMIARAERLLRSRNYERALVDALAPYLRDAIQTGIGIGFDTVAKVATSVDFEQERADLARYAETESIRLARQTARGVTQTMSVRVGEVLGTGLQDGETIDELATRVQDWAEGQKDQDGSWSRARTVARTEANRAARKAEVEAWNATGMVAGKTWLLAPDPCEFCEAASKSFSDNAIGLNESFYQKGQVLYGTDGGSLALDYENIDGPPLHPNCRCSMQPTFGEDMEAVLAEGAAEAEAAAQAEIARIAKEAGIG